ncbi:S-layer homology domain-containing protein [Domibacillus sp. DTU_2020_1001157_1_SI_ALB_TIR_016]|uniref:S-layer homology domain-containing protein n=1 Tax=Domibacillus sp. DTU_2020_1001157_1_SI_ALB_TIR_016 TaxID=3077789 RepID=UPI0028E6658E|nr:S-layer homology domain-containing protein [Domibacillus sp. DTU_2020_1001157_1_SI_ALB_TIR_016]WNS78289.1 S-layer homology domain-containing protein [Domibacillus sp. DTU_2020_1001157_1_SI_ALB_TIR_016]
MKKLSLFTAATATTVAISSLAVPASAESSHPFTDVGSRYDEAVSFLYDNEVVNGISATKFGTSQTLTRGDAAVILANMLMLDTESAPDAGFKDLNPRVKGSVNALAEIGVISGVTKTEFKPELSLSRGAMAKFLVTAFELEDYAEQTPFTDVGGVFKPYVEALYGTGVTSGKTSTSYGTNLNITRGEFANLLYGTYVFVVENSYFPVVANVQVTSATQTKINLTEAVPTDYTAADVAAYLYFSVQYSDGSVEEFEPASYSLTDDRKALMINHTGVSLTGKKGTMIVEDFESEAKAAFDFTAVKTTSSANADSSFAHTAGLPATKAAE